MRRCPGYRASAERRDGDAALVLLVRHLWFLLPNRLSFSPLSVSSTLPSSSSARERRARGLRACAYDAREKKKKRRGRESEVSARKGKIDEERRGEL